MAAISSMILLLLGCYPGWIVPKRVEVFEQKPFYQLKQKARLVITPFDTLEDAGQPAGLGITAARVFEEKLTKRNFFRKITVIPEATWLDQLEHRDVKIRKFISEGVQEQADLILYGGIENYTYGTATDTTITISVQLISTATGETIWWGKSTVQGKPGATFLLWNSNVSPDTPGLDRRLTRAADRIVTEMFASIDAIEKPGFVPGLMQKIMRPASTATKEPKAASSESDNGTREPDQAEPGSPQPGRIDNQTAQPGNDPSAPEQKPPPEQMLDQAIEKLESLDND